MFKSGDLKPEGSGRQKGTPNKTTQKVKEAFMMAFDELGGMDGLVQWARREPTEFFRIIGKLLPKDVQITGEDGGPVQIIVTTGVPKKDDDAPL